MTTVKTPQDEDESVPLHNLTLSEVERIYTDPRTQEKLQKEIGDRLRTLIAAKNLTLEDVAGALGLANKSAVSHILSGRTKLGLFHLYGLAKLLDVDERTILHGPKPPELSVVQDANMINAETLERARALIRSDWKSLDRDVALDLAVQTAKALGSREVSDQELRQEIANIIVQQLNNVASDKR
jgi:transcriptional regulator with XRE-family HTH domain